MNSEATSPYFLHAFVQVAACISTSTILITGTIPYLVMNSSQSNNGMVSRQERARFIPWLCEIGLGGFCGF